MLFKCFQLDKNRVETRVVIKTNAVIDQHPASAGVAKKAFIKAEQVTDIPAKIPGFPV